MTMDTTRKATSAEVRRHYKSLGYEVKIRKVDSKVYLKPKWSTVWLDGLWVDEYRARVHRGKFINVYIR